MNKWIGTGRATKEWEIRVTPSGTNVGKNTIAVDDGFGENKKTHFINLVVFGKTAESLDRHGFKGQKLLVEGRINTGSYEKEDGTKVYTTDVVVDRLEYLSFKENSEPKQEDPMKGFSALDDGSLPF